MSFKVTPVGGDIEWMISDGPAIIYLATDPNGRPVVYRADAWFEQSLDARNRAVMRALLQHSLDVSDDRTVL